MPAAPEPRKNEENMTKNELRFVFEGKSILDVASLIPGQYAELTSRGWTEQAANDAIESAILSTNRPMPTIAAYRKESAPIINPE